MRGLSVTPPTRLVFAAAALLFLSESAEAKLKYRSPELVYIGSNQPIPRAHIRCMKFIDDYVIWRKAGLDTMKSLPPNRKYPAALYREAVQSQKAVLVKQYADFARYNLTDWGVPPRSHAEEALNEYRAKLPDEQQNLQDKRKEWSETTDEVQRELMRRVVFFSEASVRSTQSFISYEECVLSNNLPATIPD